MKKMNKNQMILKWAREAKVVSIKYAAKVLGYDRYEQTEKAVMSRVRALKAAKLIRYAVRENSGGAKQIQLFVIA
jgi:hypothetical protein